MQKGICIFLASIVITGITLSLVGMALVPPTALAEKPEKSEVPKPIPATGVRVVKKAPLPLEARETKGKPSPQPGAATGVLGELATGNKYALVIGICDYPGEDYDICRSDGDSYNMYKTLTGLYGYDSANIYWFRDMGLDPNNYGVNGAPTRSNIYNAVREINNNATSGDEVIFFFSGHGARGTAADSDEETTDEAIVVHNASSTNLDYIWDGELKSWFSGFATTRIIFVFDSCLAGGMNDMTDTGRVVNMATGETQSAYVYSTGELGEGVFSHYFINEGMLQGKADKYDHDKDGFLLEPTDVVIEEAFDYAKANIPPYLKQRQKPVISDNFENDLLL